MSNEDSEAEDQQWIDELKDIFSLLREIKGLSKEQALAELALRLTDPNYVKFMSNLTPYEAETMAEEFVIAQRYRYAAHVADYTMEELILRCSTGGWRARQHENMIVEGKRAERVGFISRFMDRFRRKEEPGVEERRVEF